MTGNAPTVLIAAALLGIGVPWLAVRLMAGPLSESHSVENYRGKRVFLGLGVVWLVWAGCAIVGGILGALLLDESTLLLTLAGLLSLVAFALGLVDDALGSGSARGFRGHLRSLAHGRLTTGGLKLIGMGVACLVVALVLSQVAPWGGRGLSIDGIARSLLAGASIALTANFVNLLDLRPGRALKVYSALVAFGVISASWLLVELTRSPELALARGQQLIGGTVLALFAFGPVIAVWRYDAGEHGMLGDAGANPMGAVAGLFIVSGLPLWALTVFFVLVLGANVASERVSFSAVIESSRVLSWLDGLGRSHEPGDIRSVKSSPQSEGKPE